MAGAAVAQATFEFLTEQSSDVVLRADAQGVVTWCSPSIRAYGYEPQDVVGRTGAYLTHPDDWPRSQANVAAVLRGEPPRPAIERQNRYRTAAGAWVWMEGNPRALRDEDGRVVGIVNILRDVTERRAQHEVFEAAFHHAAIGKALVGLDARFLLVNDALCATVGWPRETLMTFGYRDLAHPDEIGQTAAEYGQLLAGEIASFSAERRLRRPDGSFVWVGLVIALVRHPDGAPKHFVVEVQDLSAQHAAEAALRDSEARFRLIAENTTDVIVMSDTEGRTLFISPSVRRLGHEPAHLVGRSFAEHAHPEDLPAVLAGFRRLWLGEASEPVRWRGRHGQTGEWIWLESSPSILRDPETGAPRGYLDSIRDVTLQVEQEAALAAAQAEAEAAAAAKSQFLANMSHEIRTPLTAVLGFTRLLADVDDLPATACGYVGKIAAAGNGLLAIVNDILDFSKLEAGKFEIRPKPTQAAEVCEETLTLFAGQAEAKGLTLAFERSPALPKSVQIDGDRLRQTLINLIGNAVKFTDAGGVTLRVGPAAPGRLAFEVADTGPGLDAEAQALLFKRFSQVDGSTTRQHGGTGLGLAISRGIAEAMGGALSVASAPGAGACFRLEVPAPEVELPQELAEEGGAPPIEGMRVLVVDDNPVNRELARRLLEVAGVDVSDAASGAEALAQLAQLPVDLVLMDLRMPGLDGRQTLAALREAWGPNRDVPVLAFTADADLGGDGDLSGFDGLVRKPIQPLEMFERIAAAVWPVGEGEQAHAAA